MITQNNKDAQESASARQICHTNMNSKVHALYIPTTCIGVYTRIMEGDLRKSYESLISEKKWYQNESATLMNFDEIFHGMTYM